MLILACRVVLMSGVEGNGFAPVYLRTPHLIYSPGMDAFDILGLVDDLDTFTEWKVKEIKNGGQ